MTPPFTSVRDFDKPSDLLSSSAFVERDLVIAPVAHRRSDSASSTAPLANKEPREKYPALANTRTRCRCSSMLAGSAQFNRLPSRARVVICAGLSGVWQYSRGMHAGVAKPPAGLPPMSGCQVINHTPAGYAMRQSDAQPAALRIGELIALKVEGRGGLQVAMVRWFRNTLNGSRLEFGCELVSDTPEAAAAAPEGDGSPQVVPVVVVPEDSGATGGGDEPSPAQLIAPAGAFQLEQAVTLKRTGSETFAVLTKLTEQGPGFEIFEYVAVE